MKAVSVASMISVEQMTSCLAINSCHQVKTGVEEEGLPAARSRGVLFEASTDGRESDTGPVFNLSTIITFSTVLLSFKADPKNYLTHIINIREKEVCDFWKKFHKQKKEYYQDIIGLNKISLSTEEKQSCIDALPILIRDMTFIGSYFNELYKFSTNYKHGLLLIPAIEPNSKMNLIGELAENNLFNFLDVDSAMVQKNTECIIHLVHNVFVFIVEALIMNLILSPEEQKTTRFSKTIESSEKVGGTNMKINPISYRVHHAQRILPIYKELPNMKVIR